MKAKKILLAVDMRAEDQQAVLRVWKALKPFAARDAVIEPVTVLKREDFAVGNYLKSRIGKIRPATERFMTESLQKLGIRGLAPAKTVVADGSSQRRAVLALTQYAKKNNFDLIALATHSRKGMARLFMGSFTEAMCLESSVPLLVVNPRQKLSPTKVRSLLFPTDFSAKSRQGLQTMYRQLGQDRPKIVLYHRYNAPELYQAGPYGTIPIPSSVLEDNAEAVKKEGNAWKVEIERAGFKCELFFDRKSVSAEDGILKAAKSRNVDWVAMVSTKGRAGAFLMGSLSRAVARLSPKPVWVLHPSQGAATAKGSRPARPQFPAAPRLRVAARA